MFEFTQLLNNTVFIEVEGSLPLDPNLFIMHVKIKFVTMPMNHVMETLRNLEVNIYALVTAALHEGA
jgi:hypothetical protein